MGYAVPSQTTADTIMKIPFVFSQSLHTQMSRFLVVGLIVAAIDLTVFLLLVQIEVPTVYANAIAMTAGFCIGLVGHHRFTFPGTETLALPVAVRYALTFGTNLLLGGFTLEITMQWGANALFAKLLAMSVVVASNFVLSRQFVFRDR